MREHKNYIEMINPSQDILDSFVVQVLAKEGGKWLAYTGIRTTMRNAAIDITTTKRFICIKNEEDIIFDVLLNEDKYGGNGWRTPVYEMEEELPLKERTDFDKALNNLIESCLKVCQLIERGDLS